MQVASVYDTHLIKLKSVIGVAVMGTHYMGPLLAAPLGCASL